MTYRGFDSIIPSNLPTGADAYFGYVDSRFANWAELKALFPSAHLLSIAVFPQDDAECLDVENGDATIAEVYGWFVRQQKRKVWRPVIYTSAANLGHLLATMKANGFARDSFRVWSAHYKAPAGEHICGPGTCGYPQADGTQWRDDAPGLHGTQVDESLLADSFFPPPPKPPPPPPRHAAIPLQGDGMLLIPDGYTKTVAVPVPMQVPLPGGEAWGLPSAVRLTSSSPAKFNIAFGPAEPAKWEPVSTDYARSPAVITLPLDASGNPVAVLKLQPQPGGNPAAVTVDFG